MDDVQRRKNKWVTPINMGTVLNSEGDDESPFLHPDGQTLYFRSNGRREWENLISTTLD